MGALMTRILPSGAVRVISQLLPKADDPHFNPTREVAERIAAILDVVDAVPEELIALDSAAYPTFVVNRAALRQILTMWTQGTIRSCIKFRTLPG
jgi:hypothetical protein